MPRRVRDVRDMKIDEVSLVDRPAAPLAKVAIAKRAPEEETVPEYFTEDGTALAENDFESLPFGTTVLDGEGNSYTWDEADDAALETEVTETEPVFATVGKSLADQVREDLSKALTDADRNDAISKAMDAVAKADTRATQAEAIAKAERDLRLDREYITKAAELNVPVPAEELGPVLKRAAELLSKADNAVLFKALSASGEMLFTELGFSGGGDNADIMSQVTAAIEGQVSKSDGTASKEQLITKAFETDPSLYEQYLSDRAMNR